MRGGRKPFFRRPKSCPFSSLDSATIDYKDVKLLQRFLSERGKIVPRRITAVSSKKQRELAREIKRARLISLASSRCFFEETAVIRRGTIFPRSERKRWSSLTSL